MKKLILLLSIISLFCQSSFAQTGGLNFQGVARNASGAVLANQKINLKFSILKTTETGAVEYTEIKEATTNAQGIFAVVVGEVNATNFAAVDWKASPKFLKVEMDATGGTSFITMGTTRLQNVPFAYYANGVNANNIDGAVPVSKGGTGATNVASARANLGLAIGTNVQAPLVAGKDYLAPTGTAIGLTNFPILNQNTNGNAATATKLAVAKKINGVDFDGTSDITIPTSASSNSLSGTISISNGGTGATNATEALTNLRAESLANKSTDITLDANSLTKYPSVKTVKDYVDTRVSSAVATITSVNGLQLGRGTGTNTNSVAVGKNALRFNTTGTSNTATGESALFSNTTGGQNTGFGANSLPNNTIGGGNTAIGNEALYKNISGNYNSATGHSALWNNTTGNFNSAFGFRALFTNSTGSYNTSSGVNALEQNTTGYSNTASGYNSLKSNTTGFFNTATGTDALQNNTTGHSNIATGSNALNSNTTGISNIAIGTNSLSSNTIGNWNTAVGTVALTNNTTGYGNMAFGNGALYYNTTGSGNAGFGGESLFYNTTGFNNTALGNGALYSSKGNSNSVAIGNNSMYYADDRATGRISGNTAVGFESLKGSSTPANNTGQNNTTTGYQSMVNNTAGNSNSAYGFQALLNNTTGDNNVAIGQTAMISNVGGSNNTALGAGALGQSTNPYNVTAIGKQSLEYNVAWNNTAVGHTSLRFTTTGGDNTALGFDAGLTNTTGNNNTFLGHQSDAASGNLTNATAIGKGAVVSASNTIQLGNNAVTNVKTSGAITAAGYKTPTGTSTQYLMADGSVSTGIASSTFTNKVIVGSVTETSSSAILEVNSTSKGFLPPRMTFTQRNLISNPTPGLMIYCSDCGTNGEWQGYNGNQWSNLSGTTAARDISIYVQEINTTSPLAGATVSIPTTAGTSISAVTDANGLAIFSSSRTAFVAFPASVFVSKQGYASGSTINSVDRTATIFLWNLDKNVAGNTMRGKVFIETDLTNTAAEVAPRKLVNVFTNVRINGKEQRFDWTTLTDANGNYSIALPDLESTLFIAHSSFDSTSTMYINSVVPGIEGAPIKTAVPTTFYLGDNNTGGSYLPEQATGVNYSIPTSMNRFYAQTTNGDLNSRMTYFKNLQFSFGAFDFATNSKSASVSNLIFGSTVFFNADGSTTTTAPVRYATNLTNTPARIYDLLGEPSPYFATIPVIEFRLSDGVINNFVTLTPGTSRVNDTNSSQLFVTNRGYTLSSVNSSTFNTINRPAFFSSVSASSINGGKTFQKDLSYGTGKLKTGVR